MPLVLEAERLGFDSVWSAEAYGSDAVTTVAWVAARTERIDVGTAIMQIPARTPAATAMTAITLDHLSGGRFRLGLGMSGPQVVEGWHGVPYGKPLARTREYVEIVRAMLRRDKPVNTFRFGNQEVKTKVFLYVPKGQDALDVAEDLQRPLVIPVVDDVPQQVGVGAGGDRLEKTAADHPAARTACLISSIFCWPSRSSTKTMANSIAVPGPLLVTSLPSITTRRSS